MKLSAIKTQLEGLPQVNFILPNGSQVPAHFHVTEVGQASKKYIDCGGTIREESKVTFQLWEDWDVDLFEKIENSLLDKTRDFHYNIYGIDKAPSAVLKAKDNVKNANLESFISIRHDDFFKTSKPSNDFLQIIFNPPYGERLEINMENLYADIGNTLKRNYSNSTAWFITSNIEALKFVGLRPSKKIKLFIQVNIGNEQQKSGINKEKLSDFFNFCKNLNLDIIGTMCIPPNDGNVEKYFSEMNKINQELNFKELSMGMSGDYQDAIKNNATYVRVGSKIFGNRS